MLQFVVTMIFLSEAACQTRDAWYQYNGRCYYIPSAVTNYADAVALCNTLGARPVELENQAEMVAMQDILDPTASGQYWVGLGYNITGTTQTFYWTQLQTQAPAQMWFSTEPNFSGHCVRLLCDDTYQNLTSYNATGQEECLLADNPCFMNYSVICEKDAVPISNYTYIRINQLNIPEFPWCRMLSLQLASRIECAVACTAQQTSGSCGAFVYDATAPIGSSCVMYSTDDIFTEAITTEQYDQLFIAMANWRC